MNLRGVKMLMVLTLVAAFITGCPTPGVVSVSPLSATLEVAQSLTLVATSTDPADAPFTWTNANPAVATISATSGLSVTVTAVAPGVTTIAVMGSKGGGVATTTISVPTTPAEPEATELTVTPSSAVLETAQVLTLTAASTNPADTFSWTQSNAAAVGLGATTGASVEITALAAGVSVITATGSASGTTATAAISVLTAGGEIGTTPLVPAGLVINVTDVVSPADNRPVVTFTALNNRGDVVPLVELSEARFIIAHLDETPAAGNSAYYISYIKNAAAQATYDGAGLAGLTDNGDGTYSFKFKTALPASYSMTASHAIGAQMVRKSALDGVSYPFNVDYEFRPDGNPVTVTRDLTTTATCNSCHTRLGLHGGNRREVRLCILCHNPGVVDPDTGNSVDMKVMVHKIHMGESLPSVEAGTPYQIIGFQGSVHDYSTVALPQDIRNCAMCHVTDTKAADTQANYRTKPTQAACGSCHDLVWFGDPSATPAGFENHPLDFNQPDDSMCAVCHTATAPGVSPIDAAHLTVAELPENPGLDLHITNIATNPVDGTLTIDFAAKDGAGNPITDLTPIARVGAIVAWPSPEYTTYANETIQRPGRPSTGTLVSPTSPTGEYQYIFAAKLPLDAGLSFGVAMTGRQDFTVVVDSSTTPPTTETHEQGLSDNSLTFFTVDGSDPQPRREVVDDALCAKCHGETIRGHGGSRLGVGVCVMCHNPGLGEFNFKDMLHKWHTGEELSRPFSADEELSATVAEVRFPGLRQQCSICHGSHDVSVPLAPEALPTILETETGETTVLPERAACTTCHDSLMVDIHAVINGDAAQGVETCAVCHGAGKDVDVAKVHALAP